MEFKIITDLSVLPQVIETNAEELKAWLSEKLAEYNEIVVTPETIKAAKDDKSKLTKLRTALEDRRKEVKRQCMAPYEDFERKYKELLALIDEPIGKIDTQIKALDEQEQKQKYVRLKAFFDNCMASSLGVPVDVILNNAGVQIAYRTDYWQTPVSDYMTSFQINTVSPMMLCYHFIPKMIERGFGRVVNTTSGIRLEPEQAGYSASKAALDKVTIDLGSKLEGTGVAINLTDPGWCRTDLGGPHAPNAPESALPGVIVGAFIEQPKSGRNLAAGLFYGMTLEEAAAKADTL